MSVPAPSEELTEERAEETVQDTPEELEVKQRSHQRAELIKRAREEFLGISTDEVSAERDARNSEQWVTYEFGGHF